MKKITTIIFACLISAASFQSCVVEESDYQKDTLTRSSGIFNYWRYGFCNAQMRFPNVAFNFNTWLSAPEQDRDSISKLYFPNYSIRDNGDGSWSLNYNGQEAYNIVTNGQSLSDVGASWTLKSFLIENDFSSNLHLGYSYNKDVSFNRPFTTAVVTCSSPAEWTVSVNSPNSIVLGSSPNFLSVTLSTPDLTTIRDLRQGGYYISGSGQFEFENGSLYEETDLDYKTVKMYFQIEEPLYCDGRYVWGAGKLNIVVNNGEEGSQYRSEEVKAELLSVMEPGTYRVRLLFHDQENWWTYVSR